MTPYYEDGSVQLFNGDNREILPSLGSVDHCITDPPYSRWTHEKQRTGATMPDTKGSALAGRRVGAACLARYRDLGFDALTPSMALSSRGSQQTDPIAIGTSLATASLGVAPSGTRKVA